MVPNVHEPAFGALELSSIAHGVRVADSIVKEARVRLAAATPSTPGRFFIAYWGDDASVSYAHARGRDDAGAWIVDELLLHVVDTQVVPALRGVVAVPTVDALGVLEMPTAVSTVRVGDAVAKATSVELIEIVVSCGLAGKGFVTMTGTQADVDRATEVARHTTELVADISIPNPDPLVVERVLAGRWGEFEGRRLY